MPEKILVTGSATSSLSTFFSKLSTLQTKHSFSICLALDLFSNLDNDSLELAQLLAGKIEIPLPVYTCFGAGIVPDKVLEKFNNGEEICTNLTLLSKTGLLTLASGLRIATFGGSYDSKTFPATSDSVRADPLTVPYFTSTDLESYFNILSPPSKSAIPTVSLPIDILLTHSNPASINALSAKLPLPAASEADAGPIDEVAAKTKAKYHFAGGKAKFFEREAFTWGPGQGSCRFLSLGEMGNADKERWFYAFSIVPNSPPTIPTTNATGNPFAAVPSRGIKRSADGTEVNEYGIPNFIFAGQGSNKKGRGNAGPSAPPDHYTCRICEQKGHWIQECPEKDSQSTQYDNRKPLQPDECWFCLSNPKITKHLIASIGTEMYLTLPKGQLPPTSKEGNPGDSPVPGGGHVLIIPIDHYSTMLSIPAELAEPIVSEIDKYKQALKECYTAFGASMVTFEIGKTGGKGGHAHIQVCPVPNSMADKVEICFRAEGEKFGVTFEEDPEKALIGVEDNYLRIGLPNGKFLVHLIKPGQPFNLQFGRATLATLLGIQERTDWKQCTKSDAEEKADTLRFKAAFKKYEP